MLFTTNEYRQLIENGQMCGESNPIMPVVKWIIPEFDFTFLATLIKPFTDNIEIVHGFGLKNNGKEQLSRTYIRNNCRYKELVGMEARKDPDFIPTFPIWIYEVIAKEKGSLITNVDTIDTLLVEMRREYA